MAKTKSKKQLKKLETQVNNAEKALDVIEKISEEEQEKIKKQKELEKKEKKRLKKVNEVAGVIREDLKIQLELQGKVGKHFDNMVEDYIYFYRLKEDLKHDIDENGLRIASQTGNGYTTEKDNKSVDQIIKVNGQMLKILNDLELKTPDVLVNSGNEKGDADESGDAEHDLL
ncbi:MAG: hypothetical protein IJH12_06930 [Clostridia bacterium]|nr:hypothetical protein [Clostridia bacterium]